MEKNQLEITGKYIEKISSARGFHSYKSMIYISAFCFSLCGFLFNFGIDLEGFPSFYKSGLQGLKTANAAEPELVDRIVAIVNDDIISLFELNQMIKPYAERIEASDYPEDKKQEMLSKLRDDVLNQLIGEKLTDQEVKKAGITVSEKEIDNALENIKQSNGYTDEELEKALAKEGIPLAEYRERIKEQILRSRLLSLEIKSGIVITKEDVSKYYDENYGLFRGDKKYHLRNIILKISPLADEDEKRALKSKAEDILAKLNAGESFEKLAKKYSDLLADEGGDLGTFTFDELSPQIQDAVKELNQGEFTPVLETDLGYQIFFVQEIIQMKGKTLEEATSEIQEKLFNEIVDKNFKLWLDDLRKRSHIKIIE